MNCLKTRILKKKKNIKFQMVHLHLFSSVNLKNCPKMLENLTRGDYNFIVIAKIHLLLLAISS